MSISYLCPLCFTFLVFSKEHDWNLLLQSTSGSVPSAETSSSDVKEEKSETYSHDMTAAMGAGMFNHFVVLIQQQPSFTLLGGLGYIDQTRHWSLTKTKISI